MAAASKADFEGDLDRLYQLPLSEFTSARDELVKRLRAQGESERSQEVKKLRKPTAAVWVVNQLARVRPLEVQRLLKAGETLTKKQAEAAAGKSSQAFSEARRDEQRAIEQLAKSAREIGEGAGIGSAALGRATETLRAASLTAEGRELLKRGRLTEELEPPGFEVLTGLPGVAARPIQSKAKAPAKAEQTDTRRRRKEAHRHVQEMRARERELSSAARSAEREAERAEAQASKARRRAEDARDQAVAAAKERQAAEAELND